MESAFIGECKVCFFSLFTYSLFSAHLFMCRGHEPKQNKVVVEIAIKYRSRSVDTSGKARILSMFVWCVFVDFKAVQKLNFSFSKD